MTSRVQPGSLVPPKPNGTRFPSLVYPNDPSKLDPCSRIDIYYDLTTATVFLIYIVFGILYTFLGYQCFKTVMFLTGFIFASSIVYLICLQGELMPSYGNAGVALLAGVLFGLITMLVQYVGLFVSGLHTGFLMGMGSLLVADFFMTNTPQKGQIWLCVGVLLAMALTVAVLNLYFRKSLTIVMTSIYGGAIVTVAVDYFVERHMMIMWVWQRVSLKPVEPPPCWFSWIVLAAWPSFFLTGLIVQSTVTAKGIHHEVAIGRKKPRGDPILRGQSRAEMRQNKYRYLYQVRTAHGDVISRNFVQAMQKKEGQGTAGECSTLQSDATHLTILPDLQLAAYAESEDDSQTEAATRQ